MAFLLADVTLAKKTCKRRSLALSAPDCLPLLRPLVFFMPPRTARADSTTLACSSHGVVSSLAFPGSSGDSSNVGSTGGGDGDCEGGACEDVLSGGDCGRGVVDSTSCDELAKGAVTIVAAPIPPAREAVLG